MKASHPTARYRAVSMELAAYLDGRYVEMHILTDTGKTIAVACPRDSIFAVQRQIERIGRECPEIATWSRHSRPDQEPSARTQVSGDGDASAARQAVLGRICGLSGRRAVARPR
jgi:hypothetical protein